jgi:hypothetical protein
MSAAKLVVFTMVCFSVCAHAKTQTLAVYSRNSAQLDSRTQHSLGEELTRLLSPAGVQIVWRDETRASRQEMGRLVVGTFDGNCSVENLLSTPSASPTGVTLAQSSLSNGRILPYFTVDCPRVIRTLAPTLQHVSVPVRDALLGRALARVIAHEIYHILAQTADHEESGLSKAQLSLSDLTASKFEFSPDSLRRIRASIHSMPTVPVAALLSLHAVPR